MYDDSPGMAVIAARFGFAAAAAPAPLADDGMLERAGLLEPRAVKRPILPFNLPPGILQAATTGIGAGAYLDLWQQFGPRTGWFWDITSLSCNGFTAGAVQVTKNAPAVTAAGNPYAVENVWTFASAGTQPFPQKGVPLLDATERLIFTVTSALTGYAQVSGQVVCVPAERISEYLD